MKVVRGRQVTTNRPWGAVPIAELPGLSVKFHWTDQADRWHINDGEEVFVVLDGTVDMHHRVDGREQVIELGVGDVFFAAGMLPDLGPQPIRFRAGIVARNIGLGAEVLHRRPGLQRKHQPHDQASHRHQK